MKTLSNTTKKDWIGPAIGVVVFVILVLILPWLFDKLYTPEGEEGDFKTQMKEMYSVCARILVLTPTIVLILYYLVIDRFDQWWVWFLFIAFSVILTSSIIFEWPCQYFEDKDNISGDYSDELLIFSFRTSIISFIYSIIMSFCIKPLSRHCSTTPF